MIGLSKKVFLSYSSIMREHVLELCVQLSKDGVDFVMDLFDLKAGHNVIHFMEQTVNDPSIDRVLVMCDRTYVEKSNARSGGVGYETSIFSSEIYGRVKQEKFIPIILERDKNGEPYLPTFMQGLSYIDFTNANTYSTEYEKLLRNIYEVPMYTKPKLGEPPEWAVENGGRNPVASTRSMGIENNSPGFDCHSGIQIKKSNYDTNRKRNAWRYSVVLLDDVSETLDILKNTIDEVFSEERRYDVDVFAHSNTIGLIEQSLDFNFDVFVLDLARKAEYHHQVKEHDYFGYDLFKLLVYERPNALVKSKFIFYSRLPYEMVRNEYGQLSDLISRIRREHSERRINIPEIEYHSKQKTSAYELALIIKRYLDKLYTQESSSAFCPI